MFSCQFPLFEKRKKIIEKEFGRRPRQDGEIPETKFELILNRRDFKGLCQNTLRFSRRNKGRIRRKYSLFAPQLSPSLGIRTSIPCHSSNPVHDFSKVSLCDDVQ